MPQEPKDLDDVKDPAEQFNLVWSWFKGKKRREKAIGDARRGLIELAKAIGALGVILTVGKAAYDWVAAHILH